MVNKKILIIGSTGFIGSHLLIHLLPRVSEVVTFSRSDSSIKSHRHIVGDINDQTKIKKLLKLKPDVIFILTSLSGQTISDTKKNLSFETTVKSNFFLLDELVRINSSCKVIYSSSRLEYGQPQYIPVDEQHPIQPISYYGLHKAMVSLYCNFLAKKHFLDTVVLRTSNPYGPVIPNNYKGYNLVNYFLKQAQEGKTLLIYGTGRQKRDYIFIDDFINALWVCMLSKKTKGQIYNIGSGVGVSLVTMAKEIIKQTQKGKLKFIPWPASEKKVETGDYISDISKITLDTGWTPKENYVKGISLSLDRLGNI